MRRIMESFYDPRKRYEENYEKGPFGYFLEKPGETLVSRPTSIFGYSVNVPFGIPAGPLLNSKFVSAAWKWGYAIATYKTVRSDKYPTHPFPNVIRVSAKSTDIHPGDTVTAIFDMNRVDVSRDGITNSFAVPSKTINAWFVDVTGVVKTMRPGNVLILSFMGTKREGMNEHGYINDFVSACSSACKTGAPIVEVNLSCPNFGKEGLVCYDVKTTRSILESLKKAKGGTPLLVKIGYFSREQQDVLENILDAIHDSADGVVAINTISAKVVDEHGNQALPGSPVRLMSGICGASIGWAGKEMAQRIIAYKNKKSWREFVVIGCGGVVSSANFIELMRIGVDAVQSATGAMWQSNLAIDVRRSWKEMS